MFVESMTFEEIRKEFDKDSKFLIKKVDVHATRILKLMRQTNMRNYSRYFEYVSPRKNRWFYLLESVKHNFTDLYCEPYCLFFTERSFAVIGFAKEKDILMYYTSHFFQRFFQREGLEKENLHEIIRQYLHINGDMVAQPMPPHSDTTSRIFGQASTGVALGYYHKKIKVQELRTFITNDMLRGSQVELSKQLEEKFKFHVIRQSPKE